MADIDVDLGDNNGSKSLKGVNQSIKDIKAIIKKDSDSFNNFLKEVTTSLKEERAREKEKATVAKKAVAKKAEEKAPTKATPAKKTATKKTTTKATTKKTATTKPAKTTAKKTTTKKATTKTTEKKTTAKKTPAKKTTTTKKTPEKKTPEKKTTAKKTTTTKKTPAKKAPAKKAPAKKTTTTKKTAVKKAPAKKTTAKKTPEKKVTSKKTTSKKASVNSADTQQKNNEIKNIDKINQEAKKAEVVTTNQQINANSELIAMIDRATKAVGQFRVALVTGAVAIGVTLVAKILQYTNQLINQARTHRINALLAGISPNTYRAMQTFGDFALGVGGGQAFNEETLNRIKKETSMGIDGKPIFSDPQERLLLFHKELGLGLNINDYIKMAPQDRPFLVLQALSRMFKEKPERALRLQNVATSAGYGNLYGSAMVLHTQGKNAYDELKVLMKNADIPIDQTKNAMDYSREMALAEIKTDNIKQMALNKGAEIKTSGVSWFNKLFPDSTTETKEKLEKLKEEVDDKSTKEIYEALRSTLKNKWGISSIVGSIAPNDPQTVLNFMKTHFVKEKNVVIKSELGKLMSKYTQKLIKEYGTEHVEKIIGNIKHGEQSPNGGRYKLFLEDNKEMNNISLFYNQITKQLDKAGENLKTNGLELQGSHQGVQPVTGTYNPINNLELNIEIKDNKGTIKSSEGFNNVELRENFISGGS